MTAAPIRTDAGLAAALHADKVQSGRWTYRWVLVNVARGDTVKSGKGTVAAVPISSRVVDSTRSALASNTGLAPSLADAIRGMKLPEHYPPIRRIIVGQDNALWLEEATAQAASRSWRWIDLKNGTTGVVTVPAVFPRGGIAWPVLGVRRRCGWAPVGGAIFGLGSTLTRRTEDRLRLQIPAPRIGNLC